MFAPPPSEQTRVTPAGAAAFEEELDNLLQAIDDSGAQPVISTQLMAGGQNCTGLEAYLGATQEQIDANRKLGQWMTTHLREVAVRRDLPLIDCAAELECDPSMLGDAIHLTDKGHQRVAECWQQGLQPLLADQAGPLREVGP